MTAREVLAELRKHGSEHHRKGMARFAIDTSNAFGVSIPIVRSIAKKIKQDHQLALELWQTENHEARILASIIANPKQTTPELMNSWILDFKSWDLCDQCCGNLFVKTQWAHQKAIEWSFRSEEFCKRSGYSLMAYYAVHIKKADPSLIQEFLPHIQRGASDERNFVKKSVNWALREIGKRCPEVRTQTIALALHLAASTNKTERWVASDAIREFKAKGIMSA